MSAKKEQKVFGSCKDCNAVLEDARAFVDHAHTCKNPVPWTPTADYVTRRAEEK